MLRRGDTGRVYSTFDPSNLLLFAVGLVALAVKIWALVDACTRSGPAFPVAGKLTKVAWIVILALAIVLGLAGVTGLFGLIGLVAAIVYLVDVRPAVRGVRPGGPWG